MNSTGKHTADFLPIIRYISVWELYIVRCTVMENRKPSHIPEVSDVMIVHEMIASLGHDSALKGYTGAETTWEFTK